MIAVTWWMPSSCMTLPTEGSLPPKVERVDVAIVGAGFGGLGLGVRLRDAGRTSLAILEADEGVGGTWRANTYPGVACDIPSHLYSYSFAPRPDWTRRYPRQPEILGYLEQVADERGLRPQLRLGTQVTAARFDPERGSLAAALAAATAQRATCWRPRAGSCAMPHLPAFPGLEDFRGRLVALGALGPRLRPARQAGRGRRHRRDRDPGRARAGQAWRGRLHVFQRTPPWIIARHDRPTRAPSSACSPRSRRGGGCTGRCSSAARRPSSSASGRARFPPSC